MISGPFWKPGATIEEKNPQLNFQSIKLIKLSHRGTDKAQVVSCSKAPMIRTLSSMTDKEASACTT